MTPEIYFLSQINIYFSHLILHCTISINSMINHFYLAILSVPANSRMRSQSAILIQGGARRARRDIEYWINFLCFKWLQVRLPNISILFVATNELIEIKTDGQATYRDAKHLIHNPYPYSCPIIVLVHCNTDHERVNISGRYSWL